MSDTILVPTDGSPESERALEIAIPLARALGLSITVFWCWEGLPDFEETFAAEFTDRITEKETADRAEAAAALARRRIEPAGVKWEIRSAVGDPGTEIVDRAQVLEARYIAMTTHGRSGLKRWRLGSVADKVMRHAETDTIIVAPDPEVPLRMSIERILVPLDGSERAERALEDALVIARAAGASLLLLRAYLTVIATSPVGLDVAYTQANEAALASAQRYLAGVGDQIGDVPIETTVFGGDAAQAIIEASEGADLVVMSSHGRGGLLRAALGSTTDAVIRGSGKPVLVARSPE
jgi:nucleotide-binding universal stress UspA family protein